MSPRKLRSFGDRGPNKHAALLEAIQALAECIVEVDEQVLHPRASVAGGGTVELPAEVWERLVDLARRVPR